MDKDSEKSIRLLVKLLSPNHNTPGRTYGHPSCSSLFLCEDMLKALHHKEDPQCQMTDAEVMATAIVAALDFGGNLEKARKMLQVEGYIPNMLGKSRFNPRWHRMADLFLTLFNLLGETWKQLNGNSIDVIDSFPVAVCDNYRIQRCRLYHGEDFRGYQASKKRFYYGLKTHLMVTQTGQPVEFFLTPGSYSDTSALKLYNFDLPKASQLTGDKAYNDYEREPYQRNWHLFHPSAQEELRACQSALGPLLAIFLPETD